MLLFERELEIPNFSPDESLIAQFERAVMSALPENAAPVRAVITGPSDHGQHCEIGILETADDRFTPHSLVVLPEMMAAPSR